MGTRYTYIGAYIGAYRYTYLPAYLPTHHHHSSSLLITHHHYSSSRIHRYIHTRERSSTLGTTPLVGDYII